jgi:hypothetical protein
MNHIIRQRIAILDGLRERSTLATAEFYSRIGRPAPAPAPRFIVEPRGNNEFSVVDRTTGQRQGVHTGHLTACNCAQRLEDEAMASGAPVTFARKLLGWTAAIALGLVLFAAYGASR